MAKKKTSRKAPLKECPKCKKKVHARRSVCDCGHQFEAASKKKAASKQKKTTKATPIAPKAPSLTSALKAERKTLQQRLAKIDDLLDTY